MPWERKGNTARFDGLLWFGHAASLCLDKPVSLPPAELFTRAAVGRVYTIQGSLCTKGPYSAPAGPIPARKAIVRCHCFRYQAGSWDRPRRVVAKVERRRQVNAPTSRGNEVGYTSGRGDDRPYGAKKRV